MRKIFSQLTIYIFTAFAAIAQPPAAFNYQGVARNTSGSPLVSQLITLRLSIHDGTSTGTIVYQETFTPTTNAYGLYNVEVGQGTVSMGTFSAIAWGTGNKYLQVEIDPAGGTTFTNAGTSQLMSVPYALFAGNSPSVSGTATYIPKFTGTTSLGNSLMNDNGSGVGLDTVCSPMARFQVNGIGSFGISPIYQATIIAMGGGAAANASGVYAEGGWRGVYGRNPGTASGSQAIGVHGRCEGGSYTSGGYGVLAEAVGTGPTNYGIYAKASGATGSNYAGYFSGNVNVVGSVAKSSGTFMIDHPLDPENKYLYHSFVESPDMMNVYNGNVVTDVNGYATITLPDYFEALNKDFRYQLTTIGQPSQVYVSQEISGNKFQVRSDKPNVKVSWQVTGVRQDKYANAHRVVPEVEKEEKFKGYYLNAAEWGQPQTKSIPGKIEQGAANGNTANGGTN